MYVLVCTYPYITYNICVWSIIIAITCTLKLWQASCREFAYMKAHTREARKVRSEEMIRRGESERERCLLDLILIGDSWIVYYSISVVYVSIYFDFYLDKPKVFTSPLYVDQKLTCLKDRYLFDILENCLISGFILSLIPYYNTTHLSGKWTKYWLFRENRIYGSICSKFYSGLLLRLNGILQLSSGSGSGIGLFKKIQFRFSRDTNNNFLTGKGLP